jgi:hypothetical protein
MYAFLSYQSADKEVAAKIKAILSRLGVESFLAHEDINVSEEWRLAILAELAKVDLFIPILSAHYYDSIWCKQESGIAAFREITIVPLSLDGSIPQGFMAHIQSTRIDPAAPDLTALIAGVAKCDVAFAIDAIINIIAGSSNYRRAEANFELILPYLPRAADAEIAKLLRVSAENSQVSDAGLCARLYLLPLFKSHGHLLDEKTRTQLIEVFARYPG